MEVQIKKKINTKSEDKKELIERLWKIAETGSFRPYSEYRKEKDFC